MYRKEKILLNNSTEIFLREENPSPYGNGHVVHGFVITLFNTLVLQVL